MTERSIFLAALDRPDPAERAAYLDEACAGDTGLRVRIEDLLTAHAERGSFLDQPAELGDATDALDGDAPGDRPTSSPNVEGPGTRIGAYKLLQEIGQGGMGVVYMAEQEQPVRRKVALKIIKPGMDSPQVVARFEAERQALALMDHPNIARVLDAGTTDSGRPYFVMDLVKGIPITQYCDEAKLSPRERLELFIPVCQAIQHAHQKGIIHRDVKPSNAMVTLHDGKPVPKIIDFGVAKATDQRLTERTLFTQYGAIIGTPEYMSPEQADLSGLDIDTRSDIFSLGVLLYELLTGTTPLERAKLREAGYAEIMRRIKEEEPPKPSTRLSHSGDRLASIAATRRTEPARLTKMVRGELDWIAIKALEKERTRRYETASGLARDIQRYLDDEVVEARPPSAGYRIGKFVRRQKGQVIGAGLVMLALLAGIAGTTWGLFREARANTRLSASLDREQKANADLAAANAKVEARYNLAVDAIKTFHTGVSEDFLLKEEKFKELRNRLLKSASDFYAKLGALLGKETDPASRRALAKSNFELAELTEKVGHKEDALAMHQAVLAVREALAAEPAADSGVMTDVGRSLTAVAQLLQSTGKDDEALATYCRAEAVLAGPASSDSLSRAALAACRAGIGFVTFRMGRTDESMAAYRKARADQEALVAAPGVSAAERFDLAATVFQFAVCFDYMGRHSEAEAEFRTALGMFRKLVDEYPESAEYRSSLANNHLQLGATLWLMGRPRAAEPECRTALRLYQKLADENPAVTRFRWNEANGREWLGGLLLSTAGRPAEAEAECRAGLAIVRRLVDENPDVTDFRGLLAVAHNNLSGLLLQRGEPVAAEAESRAALAILQPVADEHRTSTIYRNWLACIHDGLGDAVRVLGRFDDARKCHELAIAVVGLATTEDRADYEKRLSLGYSLRRRGLALRDLGDPTGAAADMRQALGLEGGLLPSPCNLFEVACCHAALAGLAGRAGSGVPAAEGEAEAAKAMECLGRAVANGFRNANLLRIESALDPLRDRADFKKLEAELRRNVPTHQERK